MFPGSNKCQKSLVQVLETHLSDLHRSINIWCCACVLRFMGVPSTLFKKNMWKAATVTSRCLRKPAATQESACISPKSLTSFWARLLHLLYIKQGRSSFSFESVWSFLHVEDFLGLYRLLRLLLKLKCMSAFMKAWIPGDISPQTLKRFSIYYHVKFRSNPLYAFTNVY